MFEAEGSARTNRQNRRLTLTLATVAGYVNSSGFVLIGSFTSHVTGNVGRFANDLALGKGGAAISAALLASSFFGGAFLSSMAIESHPLRVPTRTYAGLLLAEAGVLAAFLLLFGTLAPVDARGHDALAMLLCLAMGLQNSLVTRLSGAVVRTTHLTGAVTDLGIEAARWFRHWRFELEPRLRLNLTVGDDQGAPPSWARASLLIMLILAFIAGSSLGAVGAVRLGPLAAAAPIAALVAMAIWALLTPSAGEEPATKA